VVKSPIVQSDYNKTKPKVRLGNFFKIESKQMRDLCLLTI
jgi:hypothetical protein